jgi:hypothetical protein
MELVGRRDGIGDADSEGDGGEADVDTAGTKGECSRG